MHNILAFPEDCLAHRHARKKNYLLLRNCIEYRFCEYFKANINPEIAIVALETNVIII